MRDGRGKTAALIYVVGLLGVIGVVVVVVLFGLKKPAKAPPGRWPSKPPVVEPPGRRSRRRRGAAAAAAGWRRRAAAPTAAEGKHARQAGARRVKAPTPTPRRPGADAGHRATATRRASATTTRMNISPVGPAVGRRPRRPTS